MKQLIILLLVLPALQTQAQNPIIMEVGDEKVSVDEFLYIYSKNHGEEADFSRESLEEYLELYTNFKLKVLDAKNSGIDTISALQQELEGYRKQLANSYLIDKELKEKIMRELFERQQQDLAVSHILFPLHSSVSPADSARTLKTAKAVYDELQKGADFKKMVKAYSGDPAAKENEGYLGYVTAGLPEGMHEVENVLYSTPEGEITPPVLSKHGYHIFKIEKIRNAKGEVEAAHILVRTDRRPEEQAKEAVQTALNLIRSGKMTFAEVAQRYSDDQATASRGGYIGRVAINQYEEGFEQTLFSLDSVGAVSEPYKSPLGYHLIKLVDKEDMYDYEERKADLNRIIENTGRIQKAKEGLVKKIKKEAPYHLKSEALDDIAGNLDSSFFIFNWKAPKMDRKVLFTLGEEKYFTNDFMDYLKRNTRLRLSANKKNNIDQTLSNLLDHYVEEQVLKFEENRLEEKYPDFRHLMREYREGILLFEITKQKVWDRAIKDTIGLRNYFKEHRDRYMWDERAIIIEYNVHSSDLEKAGEVREFSRNHSPDKVIQKFNDEKNVVSYTPDAVEKEDFLPGELNLKWKEGDVSPPKAAGGKYVFYKVETTVPPEPKKLEEVRGFVIADYQEELEKEWISSLSDRYEVEVNKSVLKDLIR